MNTIPVQAQTPADELNVQLRDLMPMLGYTKHYDIRSRLHTFMKKAFSVDVEKTTDGNSVGCFQTDYFDSLSLQYVRTYTLKAEVAMAFAMWVDPSKGIHVLRALNRATLEPATPTLHKTCNKRILAERYNRPISSITKTFERNREWIKEIGGSELHIEERDGELWFTEQYAACIAFGGGKKAVQVKVAAMVAATDNPQLEAVPLDPILRLVK